MVRKLLFGLAILCLLDSPAVAQTYVPYSDQAVINQNGLKAAAFAQIIVCTTSTCTASTGTKATIYSNSTGSGGPKANPFAADQNGNFTFWVAAGTYYIATQPSHTPPVTPFPVAIGGAGGTGSVTSVAATGDGVVLASSVSGSPVTTAGTLALALKTQSPFTLLANNSGSTAAPTFVDFATLFGSCSTALTFTSNAFGCNTGLGTGTVTQIDTTGPLSGGPVTTTGTFSCPTCVTSTSPGAGVAHFDGSTQDVTSSAVVGADFGASIAANSWFGNATGSPAAPVFNTSAIPTSVLPSSVVQNDQSNTYSTGTQDFSNATHFIFPKASSPSISTDGEIAYNTTSKLIEVRANGASYYLSMFPIALSPTNADCTNWVTVGSFSTQGDFGNPCNAGTGGSGTVTSFSAGNLSPLFTTSVATSTVTPALSFALSNAGINTVFAGPPSGSPGAPSYQTAPTISAANMTNFPTLNQNTSGTAANLSGTPALPNGTTATTQTTSDNTTKLATDAFVNAVIANSSTTVNGQTCTLGSTCGIPFSTNGSGNTSIAGINFKTSTANVSGIIITPSNPGTIDEKFEASGTPTAAGTLTGFTTPTPAGTARIVQLVASGTVAMSTGSLAAGACQTTTQAATGAVNTDQLDVTFQTAGVNVDIFTITGYNPQSATGMLTLSKWVSAGQVNIRACSSALNPAGTITPGAVNASWRVTR